MTFADLRVAVVRVALSVPVAGIFYFAWMGVFILSTRLHSLVIEVIAWLLAPVVTAAGFATGVAIAERLNRTGQTPFLRLFICPLIGCAVGAGVVYRFGPMLIVFAMFGLGTASVILREVFLRIVKTRD